MRRFSLLLAGLVILAGATWTAVVHAQANIQNGAAVGVAAGTTVDQAVFAAGQTVDIAGTVNGDVYCVGQSVTVSGTVNGDVFCAGQDVAITGTINGSARLAAQTVTFGGRVQRTMSALGQTVAFSGASRVGGDAVVAGQNLTLNGSVGRDALLGATFATLNGTVGRDVQTSVTQLTLGRGARITGDLIYTSPQLLTRATGSAVGGTITRFKATEHVQTAVPDVGAVFRRGFAVTLLSLLSMLLTAVVLVLIFPQIIHRATEVAVREPLRTFVVGLIASIVVPVVLVALTITVVGIPLAILGGVAWLLACLLALPLAAYYTGSLILSKSTDSAVWIMLGGSAVLLVLMLIPLVNVLVWLVSMWFGLGILLMHVPRLPRPDYRVATSKN